MGGICSKSSNPRNKHSRGSAPVNYYGAAPKVYQQNEFRMNSENEDDSSKHSNLTTPRQSTDKQPQEWKQLEESGSVHEVSANGYESSEDDFYDGIPRFPRGLSQKSRSIRSKQAAAAKVSEVSSRLGKASSLGFGKAVEVLDTLGTSMTNLNPSSGFVSGVTTKGNELQILAFEVANTIVKGYSLMQSLSKWSIRQLKKEVLASEGVQYLVSKDITELLNIVATDKREELKIFSGEVIRFGNRCKDSQWHNLDRYFEKRSKELAHHKQLQEEAEQMMKQLMTLVQCTAELYHELTVLDRFFEQDYQRKRQEDDNPYAAQRGDSLAFLRGDLKGQRKVVKNLKKKSLWSRSLEEVMEKLVDIVLFLNREIHAVFDNADGEEPSKESLGSRQRLGSAGLSLHYANIVIQIDTIVARCNSMPASLRNNLYQNLPPNMKSALRLKLLTFHAKEGLTVAEIKDEMEKTLRWLVPIAINTAKAHHGFGWVGEWANTGSDGNQKRPGAINVIRVETFHYADKEKTETCILELLLWLNHLVKQCKNGANGSEQKSQMKSPVLEAKQHSVQSSLSAPSPKLSIEDGELPRDVGNKEPTRGVSKSQDFDSTENRLTKNDGLSNTSGQAPTSKIEELFPDDMVSSGIAVTKSGAVEGKTLDDIDRVDTHR